MSNSLLFIPDISGFTRFVQTTEVEHSQHVIAELLEVLIGANTLDLELAEVEGDALFFYKEEAIPTQENLLAQIETMFTAFYSHLKLLENNRICPCNACAKAPNLELKIVAHSGALQFITVQSKRKPFGKQVIEAHRLLKNSVDSDNYVLIGKSLANEIGLRNNYSDKIFTFQAGTDHYDGKSVDYFYSILNPDQLKLKPFSTGQKVTFDYPPQLTFEQEFPIDAEQLLEFITNYQYRHYWVKGVDKFEYNEEEVTRIGTEHVCVINGKHLNFKTVTKDAPDEQYVYGEQTSSPPPVDQLYQFFLIQPISEQSCHLTIEMYWEAKSLFKKLALSLFVKKLFRKNIQQSMKQLEQFILDKKDKTLAVST